MPKAELPVASTVAEGRTLQATGQVKAFLVNCSVTGVEDLVGRDAVVIRGKKLFYFCKACKCKHELHLWPKGG